MHSLARPSFSLFGALALAAAAPAQIDVWLDFTSDLHDGAGGGANGTADWIDELNQAAAAAGVSNFTASERATIQANVAAQIVTMFTGYNVNIVTTAAAPAGPHDTIYFGVESSPGVLGFAPLDIGNQFTEQVTNVATASFGFFIESSEARASQVTEISSGLAGTAAHELGHSIGLLHHHAYSDAGITAANFSNTAGLQNQYIIATGSTGLGETGRETLRTLSPFSRVMLDISGGSAPIFSGQDNDSLVTGGIVSDRTENGSYSTLGTDAGDTIGTAQALTLATGPTSGRDIAFVEADLDVAGDAGVDIYEFTTTAPKVLLAHVYSTDLVYGSSREFDAMLEVLDSAGTLVPNGSADDVFYSGNLYGAGTFRDDDPFLINIDLATAGTYYLRVSSVGGGELGSNYWLVAALGDSGAAECWMILGGAPSRTPIGLDPLDLLLVSQVAQVWPVTIPTVPTMVIPSFAPLNGVELYYQVAMINQPVFPNDPIKMSNGLKVTIGGPTLRFGAGSGIDLWADMPAALGMPFQPAFRIAR